MIWGIRGLFSTSSILECEVSRPSREDGTGTAEFLANPTPFLLCPFLPAPPSVEPGLLDRHPTLPASSGQGHTPAKKQNLIL
jgi:hypothetical protein